jgi:hypothetical protein
MTLKRPPHFPRQVSQALLHCWSGMFDSRVIVLAPDDLTRTDPLVITADCLHQIRQTIDSLPAETGDKRAPDTNSSTPQAHGLLPVSCRIARLTRQRHSP